MAKQKLDRMVTPTGQAVWPRLNKPDLGNDQVKVPEGGVYRVGLSLPAAAAAPLIEKLTEAMDASYAAGLAVMENEKNPKKRKEYTKKPIVRADPPWKDDVDEQGNETGNIVFSFKMRAVIPGRDGNEGWTQRPPLFDAKGSPLDPAKVRVGAGSLLKVSFEVLPFTSPQVGAGVSLRMRAVQVLKLVEFQTGTAKSHGFEAVDDGFVYEPGEYVVAAPDEAVATSAGGSAGGDEETDF